MQTYDVTFIQYWTYTVDAEDETEAERVAHSQFSADMHCSVAYDFYDDVMIEAADDHDE